MGTFGFIEFYLSGPTGKGPAGPTVNADDFQNTWSERPVQLIGIGDSITAGPRSRRVVLLSLQSLRFLRFSSTAP
jgi:hypothetical protein|tara:strand:- start:1 stop:225 length:225 start_codon:yes stop_codon:yes gene_type:complete